MQRELFHHETSRFLHFTALLDPLIMRPLIGNLFIGTVIPLRTPFLSPSTIYPSASTNFSIENLQTNTLHTCALPVLAIIKQFIRPTLLWNKIKLFINKQSTQLFLPSYTKMIVIVRMQYPITFTPRCIQICNNIHRETRHECAV